MAKKATAKSKSKGIVYKAFLRQGSVAPYVHDYRYTNDEWVWHGDDNLWPEKVRTLVDNCGPLERSATMLSEFIAGEGVYFVNEAGDEMPEAKKRFQEWMLDTTEEQFLAQTAYDIALGMGFTWMVRRSEGGDIVRIDHMDRFGFRAAKMKGGRIPAFWWSNSWTEVSRNSAEERYKPKPYPAFDPSGEKKHAAEILFAKQYRQREPYYGRFFWLGAWNAAEVWTKVDDYNRNQIDTGFSPAVLLGLPVDGSEAEIDKHIQGARELFTGSSGDAVMPYPMGLSEVQPKVDVLERGNHAGDLDEIRSAAADVIYDTFGLPSLLLRDREEGLTSQEKAIHMRLQQLQRTVVATLQKLMTRELTRLMNLSGIAVYDTKIKPLKIFDVSYSDAIMEAVQSVDEIRETMGLEPWPDEEYGKKPIALAKVPEQLQKVGPDGKPIQEPNPGDDKPVEEQAQE